MDFLIIDGIIVKRDEADLTHLFLNEPFRLSQKVWYGFGGIPLLPENVSSLIRQVNALKLPFPKELENKRELFRISKRMLNKNKFYRSGYLHFQLLWDKGKPETLVTSNSFSEFDFPFSKEGVLLSFSNQKKKALNSFNRYAFFNKTLWQVSLKELNETHFQNAVILNENNAVCECAFSNIFMIKGNEMITPSLTSGCYNDVLRTFILKTATALGMKAMEVETVKKGDLKKMDEIFIAGEQTGIQWILGIENKRFLHHISKRIHDKLNEFLKKRQTNSSPGFPGNSPR
jgi:branched-subunit amino acid aminotransferase/4-amino-4-deoxychorismate lyase